MYIIYNVYVCVCGLFGACVCGWEESFLNGAGAGV